MNSINPPPNPSSDSVLAAYTLISVAADPATAKQRLDALLAAHDNIKQAHDEMQAERQRLIAENASL